MTEWALWIGVGVVMWLLTRRRLFELWDDVRCAQRQVDIQRRRRAALAARFATALGDRLAETQRAALSSDDPTVHELALAELPPPEVDEAAPLPSMRAELASLDARLLAARQWLRREQNRYAFLAPYWIGVWVGAPRPAGKRTIEMVALEHKTLYDRASRAPYPG